MKEMKFAVLFATTLLFVSSLAYAASNQLYWHSYDYYSIELSGSGNAFVVGTISLEALTQQQVNTVTLEIPYTGITIFKLVQNGRYMRPPCIAGTPPMPCDYVYEPSSFLNYTTQTLSDSTILTINLAYPVQNDTDTTLYLVFSTRSIATKDFQGFPFNFKTVQDPNALIRSLSANVVVPENMYLKWEPKFDIQYKPSDIAAQSMKASAEAIIGIVPPRNGNAQYSASNLQPGESFTISGMYGDNWILLYFQEIVLVVVGLFAVGIVAKYVFANRVKKIFARRGGEERIARRTEFSFARPIIVGFVSSLIFISVYYLLNVLFGSSYYGNVTSITLLVINAVFVLLSLFGLPYFLYSKYSKAEGILAGIISLVLSFVLLILLLPQYSPPIIYNALKGFAESSGVSTGSATVTPK